MTSAVHIRRLMAVSHSACLARKPYHWLAEQNESSFDRDVVAVVVVVGVHIENTSFLVTLICTSSSTAWCSQGYKDKRFPEKAVIITSSRFFPEGGVLIISPVSIIAGVPGRQTLP